MMYVCVCRALLSYKNYLFWQPYYHCLYGSLLCMEEPRCEDFQLYPLIHVI